MLYWNLNFKKNNIDLLGHIQVMVIACVKIVQCKKSRVQSIVVCGVIKKLKQKDLIPNNPNVVQILFGLQIKLNLDNYFLSFSLNFNSLSSPIHTQPSSRNYFSIPSPSIQTARFLAVDFVQYTTPNSSQFIVMEICWNWLSCWCWPCYGCSRRRSASRQRTRPAPPPPPPPIITSLKLCLLLLFSNSPLLRW